MKQYVVDAFSENIFGGNPAAICVMDSWISDELMLNIAMENNLSETVFAVKEMGKYKLRWFTPGGEIDLCGHATLACAFVIMNYIDVKSNKVIFSTMSGELIVKRKEDLYQLDFPEYKLTPVAITKEIIEAVGATPKEAYIGRDLLCIFDDENIVKSLNPNMDKLKNIDGLLLHISAPGKEVDCVSRSFAPKLKVNEDPVCGSGHCHIAPYWIKRLNKKEIIAYQASKRGGTLYCTMDGSRVKLSGKAVLYSIAVINIEN